MDGELTELLDLADDAAFAAHALAQGWTDGLPVIAPTPERVRGLVETVDHDPLQVLGIMPPAQGIVTVHATAVNAVMAGCGPAHFPILLAAVRAVLEPAFNLKGVQATTSPVTPAILVTGPAAAAAGVNAGHNCFGPGTQANAVIGRALRLVLLNIGGGTPGHGDMATQGQPGKYGFCFAENQAASPWAPYHVDRGFAANASCVTAFQAGMIVNVLDFGSKTAEELLVSLAAVMAGSNTNNMQLGDGDLLVVLCPEHAGIIAADGLSRRQVQEGLFTRARARGSAFSAGVLDCVRDWRARAYRDAGPETLIDVVEDPAQINVVVAGGAAGGQSSFIPGFGDGYSVCVEV
jgi:hypothetical protein